MNERIKILKQLFSVFFRIGLFTVGGGYAMLPMLEREVVDRYGWISEETMMDYYAIGQSTPGIIAINTATFIGYNQMGTLGALVSTLGMVFPSWIIITIIAMFYGEFNEIAWVQSAFFGIRICVIVLILNAANRMRKKAIIDKMGWVIFTGAIMALLIVEVSPIAVVIGSAAFGALLPFLSKKGGQS